MCYQDTWFHAGSGECMRRFSHKVGSTIYCNGAWVIEFKSSTES